MALVGTFMLSLVAWAIVPFSYCMVLLDPNIGLLSLFAISSLVVYGILLVGLSSNSGEAIRSPMIEGPMGQKLVCAAGVERSTLHRGGLTWLGLGFEFIKK
ncbi:NADH-ubiquinone oxidoreductase chain 1 [Platanthera guangdongensis]|uniref:NADH-ubiquinone oxidoreductase chain 1 n=1 Tax=Platanthera guangdongensis TaxID=2320717 RepID=A0ABR2MYU4_9ASPA